MLVIAAWLVVLAGFAAAEPFQISADRVIAVHTASEYSDLDWNGDGFQDSAIIAISANDDAIDLFLVMSDPDTGEMRVSDIAYGILPFDPNVNTRADYSIGPDNESYMPMIGFQPVGSDRSIYIRVNADIPRSMIIDVLSLQANADGQTAEVRCEIVFEGLYYDRPVPFATIFTPEGETVEYSPGPPPDVATWTYRALPPACLP